MQLGGDEDAPQGCSALLCRQPIDVLCHSALRAREAGVFVATSSDAAELDALVAAFAGTQVLVTMEQGRVVCAAAAMAAAGAAVMADAASTPEAEAKLSPAPVDLAETRCASACAIIVVV